ncbi:DNA damage-binding protein 2-like [Phalaenopsis equestris]|uniref:DNA damage-binding protein 2-like n=1 Tax=Phalaenopsis equestris TaxID=78828 RepID=UPI0009E434B9|nr:DNA damage-binding protein 2-like [Phalaenopsis equestris]
MSFALFSIGKMAAASRPRKRPTIIDGSLDGSSSASSSSEEEAEESEEEGLEDAVNDDDEKKGRGRNGSVLEKGVGKKAPAIIISLKKVCKVCKEEGHQAGFQGANYIDCPRKPCFLCKMPGHTTMSCPHRVALEHGVVPALRKNKQTQLDYVFERQLMSQIPKVRIA